MLISSFPFLSLCRQPNSPPAVRPPSCRQILCRCNMFPICSWPALQKCPPKGAWFWTCKGQ